MGDRRGACRVLVGRSEGKKFEVEAMTGMFWLWLGTGGGCFECGNEPSGSIKC